MAELSSKRKSCGHRSPLNYDRSRYATCKLPADHGGKHRDGEFVWTNATMPWRAPSRV